MRKTDEKKQQLHLNTERRNFCRNTALFTAGMMLPSLSMEAMANVFNAKN